MMLKSYEAVIENDQIRWLAEQPEIKSARVIVTILQENMPTHQQQSSALLATLGGSQPGLQPIPRRRYDDE